MSDRTAEHGTFVMTRTYPAAPERALAAWASRDAKARWFCEPAISNDALELAFRVGGTETKNGGPPDGPTYTYEATYRDLVPAARIVHGSTMDADGTLISVSVSTVEIAATIGGTTLLTPSKESSSKAPIRPPCARRAPWSFSTSSATALG
jgi:uncharacterized protein YndB with AHSA1/START domain